MILAELKDRAENVQNDARFGSIRSDLGSQIRLAFQSPNPTGDDQERSIRAPRLRVYYLA